MVSYHCNEPPDELEIQQMIWIDVRGWVNLQAVIVLIGIFKKTVHWIEHFMGQEEKPLPRTQQWKLQDFNFMVRQSVNLVPYLLNYQISFLTFTFTLTKELVLLSQMKNMWTRNAIQNVWENRCPVYQDLCIHTEYQNQTIFKAVIITFSLLLLLYFHVTAFSTALQPILGPWPPCCQSFETVVLLQGDDVCPHDQPPNWGPGYLPLSCTLLITYWRCCQHSFKVFWCKQTPSSG